METIWVKIESDQIPHDEIKKAGDIIKKGGLVAFPTETVYGLGGDALNKQSSCKIYEAKGRPSDNPLIVHIASMDALDKIAVDIPDSAYILADKFWPGPLTMIFRKSAAVPYETTGGLDTVAVRFPSDKVALELIKASGGYIAAPSANTSGRPSPTTGKHVYEDLKGKINMLLDSSECNIGLESTIIDLTENVPMILRPGYITEEMLREIFSNVMLDSTILNVAANVAPRAPGMKYKHYAPKGEVLIVNGETDVVVEEINQCIKEKQKQGYRVGVIATDETSKRYLPCDIKSVGERTNETGVAHALYDILREFDADETDFIYSEAFSDKGIGQAIMNRLLKAAGHNVKNV